MHQLPTGFVTGSVHCGVKSEATKRDLSLFVSDQPCTAVGVFTQNLIVGAPVQVSRVRVPTDRARAVVINSGCSNACTGERGLADAREMTSEVAAKLACEDTQVLVCSTGIIGEFLPMPKIRNGIDSVCGQLGNSADHLHAAACGMMTTDTVPKVASRTINVGGEITLTGVAKGAAMIAPNMATMLAVLMTDGAVPPGRADQALRTAVDQSFNCISVEGHTSTSDSVILLANGSTGIDVSNCSEWNIALREVCEELAQAIVRDAEGGEHFVILEVTGAVSERDARKVAHAIANSPLVKTAFTGNDPNWGRIISAAGYAGGSLGETSLTLSINGTTIYRQGTPADFDEPSVSRSMATGEILVQLNLGDGPGKTRFWTSDLTAEYIRLNAEYTT